MIRGLSRCCLKLIHNIEYNFTLTKDCKFHIVNNCHVYCVNKYLKFSLSDHQSLKLRNTKTILLDTVLK